MPFSRKADRATAFPFRQVHDGSLSISDSLAAGGEKVTKCRTPPEKKANPAPRKLAGGSIVRQGIPRKRKKIAAEFDCIFTRYRIYPGVDACGT
jgi:hypothetical protein